MCTRLVEASSLTMPGRTDAAAAARADRRRQEDTMERPTINPWNGQAQFGYSQAVGVSGAERVLFCAGQRSVDGDGRPLHAGDMRAQLNQALDNLQAILAAVGWGLSDVVRLNYYTTDVDQ